MKGLCAPWDLLRFNYISLCTWIKCEELNLLWHVLKQNSVFTIHCAVEFYRHISPLDKLHYNNKSSTADCIHLDWDLVIICLISIYLTTGPYEALLYRNSIQFASRCFILQSRDRTIIQRIPNNQMNPPPMSNKQTNSVKGGKHDKRNYSPVCSSVTWSSSEIICIINMLFVFR